MTSQTIDIHYQTLALPPPYAYTYRLRIELTASALDVNLDRQYTGRDELSEDEIWAEGYTPNDDFQWKGNLPSEWSAPLRSLLKQTRWLSAETASIEDTLITFTIINTKNQIDNGIPHNLSEWDYLLQELIQGIYEVSERELPLRIRYLEIKKNRRTEATLEAQFARRRFTVTIPDDNRSPSRDLPWSTLRPLLSAMYVPDYHTDQAQSELPQQLGRYIHPGDAWYRLGRAVTNPGKTDAVANLQRAIAKVMKWN